MVTVNFFGTIRGLTGDKELTVEAKSVSSLIQKLSSLYDNHIFDEKVKGAAILLNGKNIVHLKGRKTKLEDGDVVSIFPPVGGG